MLTGNKLLQIRRALQKNLFPVWTLFVGIVAVVVIEGMFMVVLTTKEDWEVIINAEDKFIDHFI